MPDIEYWNPFLDQGQAIRSLNRATVAALPGIRVDEGVLGKRGYDLLSTAALRQLILPSAAALGLDPDDPDVGRAYDRCFDNPATRPAALAIARTYGRRLAYFLLMLQRGDPENRAARPEWKAEHWLYWTTIERVGIGGGMMAGHLGAAAVEAANLLLRELESELVVELSPYASHLPLVGLARSAPRGVDGMLLLDFGQTSVKRGVARLKKNGWLRFVEVWPSLPSPCEDIYKGEHTLAEVRERWERMFHAIETSAEAMAARGGRNPGVAMCISCYLQRDGHPFPNEMGCYGSLQMLAPNLEAFIERELHYRLHRIFPLVLEHDGTAAAAAFAGSPHTLVLTLGTAIGNGFAPEDKPYRSLAADFRLSFVESIAGGSSFRAERGISGSLDS